MALVTTISRLSIIACWLIFVGYWIISASNFKPVAQRQSLLSGLAHRGPLMVGYIMLFQPTVFSPLGVFVTPHNGPARVAGAILCLFGLVVAIWSRRTLAGNWSSSVTLKQDHELIQTGPYRFVRHPIYTGLLTMCLGTAIAGARLGSWLGFLLFCFALWTKHRQEESLMLRHFPDEYPAYRARTKALVPFVV